MYLDGGIEPAKEFVHRFLLDDVETKSLFYDANQRFRNSARSMAGSSAMNL